MTYSPPTVDVVGTLEDLTLVVHKATTHTPDGYKLHHLVLTSN